MRRTHSWTLVVAALLGAAAGTAAAQETARPSSLLTQRGWEIGGQISSYHYEEPNFMQLDGERAGFAGAYTHTSPNRVYGRFDFRASYGLLEYESVGSGSKDDIPDWISEARAVIGRDYLVNDGVALSPYIGLGYRYLYNDFQGYTSTGRVGYRRYSHYLYMPIGVTARFRIADAWVIAPTAEYDAFLGGRQESKLSDGGVVQGCPFVGVHSDITNKQSDGRGYRAYLMFESRHWAFGPWLHYWKIKDSDVVPAGLGCLGMEPENWTREYGIEIRYRF